MGDHIAGRPTHTKNPKGAKQAPTYGVVPHDGTTTMLRPPYGQLVSDRNALNHRNRPPSMRGSRPQTSPAMPLSARPQTSPAFSLADGSGTSRSNAAAMSASGVMLSARGPAQIVSNTASQPLVDAQPQSDQLRNTVSMANEEAQRCRMPTETEILAKQLGSM